jgi:predicted metalloprotease with PDZ domain
MLKIAAQMYRWTKLPTKCDVGFQVLPVLFGCLVFGSFSTVNAQTVTARISVISTNPARVRVSAELNQATRTVSFRQTYAGILGLGERIPSLQAFSGSRALDIHTMGAGEFRADEAFSRFSYEVDLAPPSRPSQMSHVSWLNQDRGLLLMADLLPQRFDGASSSKAQITIEAPDGWSVRGNLSSRGSTFALNDPESAIFLLSRSIHEKQQRVSSIDVSVILSGEWPVSESEVLKSTVRILKEYLRVTKFTLRDDAFLFLVPYAGGAGPDNWTSETRGNAVVLLLGKNSTARRVLARLEVVLSHELFHLWVPNSLKLPGAYDWFFEGFTIYQALRTDLRLGFISFDGYLETLARVMDSYTAASSDSLSLLDASEQRWTTSAQTVYEQGMLVAFLYDLMLRRQTGCEASLEDVYPKLFGAASAGQASANEIIIKLLTEPDDLQMFARDYLERPAKINFDEIFSSYGIVQSSGSGPTRWTPAGNLTPAQRKLLGCLGYKK